MMIYLVHEFIMGEWMVTVGAYQQLFDASSIIERIMGNERLELEKFFTEDVIYTKYWFITNKEKTFMIQTIKLT